MQTDQSPSREEVALRDCPPGPFLFNGHLGFKTEYGACRVDENGANMPGSKVRWVVTNWPEAYVMSSGEAFWGGAKTDEDRAALMVTPVDADAILALLTPSPQTATVEVKVEQRHRDYAAGYLGQFVGDIIATASLAFDRIPNGKADNHSFVQAFARFERDHLTPASQHDADASLGLDAARKIEETPFEEKP